MNISDLNFPFRTYAAGEPAARVSRDLARYPVPFAVIRRIVDGDMHWYPIGVDDKLLERLRKGRQSSVAHVLSLASMKPRVAMAARPGLAVPDLGGARDVNLLVDAGGTPRSVLLGFALPGGGAFPPLQPPPGGGGFPPRSRATVFPHVESPGGKYVDPGQVVEIVVSIDKTPPPTFDVHPMDVTFPDGAETLDLVAEISSTAFEPAGGGSWLKTFKLTRQLDCTPPTWTVAARAKGDLDRYGITVRFAAGGQTLGDVNVQLIRRGLSHPERTDTSFLAVPPAWGAPLRISVTRQGSVYKFSCFAKDELRGEAEVTNFPGDQYFAELENTTTLGDLQALSDGLVLPDAVEHFLREMDDDELQMEIAADDRMAPFEVVRTRPKDPRSYLGVRCGITRWIGSGKAPMANPTVAVTSMACIRPDYVKDAALPSARAEEVALQQRFGDRVKHVATMDDLAELLNRADVRLIHFAGHADGNPPRLSLEGGGFPGMRFTRERPLLAEAHPFFFINGCRAGVGRPDAAPILGDFAKLLLRNGCVGVVAPTIKVQSTAALGVAEKFYEQAGSVSVAEALRRARALVLGGGPDELAASYLSYVFCGPPELCLQF